MNPVYTILFSTILSSGIIGTIVFIFKKTVEKGIATKFKEIEEKQRLVLKEEYRRQGKIFDDQYDSLKSILAVVYRIRNNTRDLISFLEGEKEMSQLTAGTGTLLKRHNEYSNLLRDTMIADRAIVPEILFAEVHDMLHCNGHVDATILGFSKHKRSAEQTINDLRESFVKIDRHYNSINAIVKSVIGMKETE